MELGTTIKRTYYKTFPLVAVSTIEVVNIRLYDNKHLVFFDNPVSEVNSESGIYQHLYVTGENSPKVWDWVVVGGNFITQLDESDIENEVVLKRCSVIVATTDTNISVPLISEEIQRKYVEMNGPNKIDVLVVDDGTPVVDQHYNTIGAKLRGDRFQIQDIPENRIAFFGLYPNVARSMNGNLELKDTSLLTDKEVLDLIRFKYEYPENIIQQRKSFLIDHLRKLLKNDRCDLTSTMVDYLRYKGYAWEWLGLSVIEQINLGWITLKLNN